MLRLQVHKRGEQNEIPAQEHIGDGGLALATQAAAQIVFYEHDDFAGRSFTAEALVDNFERSGFNDRASSVVVYRERWEVCTDARFQGCCTICAPAAIPR
jgi:hypothetical protein